jgi:hypothetical protein
MLPPVNMILFAVEETVPLQVFPVTFTTVKGDGRLSVKLTPVYGEAVGFCSVMVRVVMPPAGKAAVENRFVTPIA